jgi:hypothetical protein
VEECAILAFHLDALKKYNYEVQMKTVRGETDIPFRDDK